MLLLAIVVHCFRHAKSDVKPGALARLKENSVVISLPYFQCGYKYNQYVK